MRAVFTHTVAVIAGVTLGACSIALAGRSAIQSAPTHADMTNIVAELRALNFSAKGLNNTTYNGLWRLCRIQLNRSIDDTAASRAWCNSP
jgi:hypothetical protein